MTSIEWLKKELEEYGSSSHLELDWKTFDNLIEQAKEMHKKEIINAVNKFALGSDEVVRIILKKYNLLNTGEAYYNETYKK